MNPQLAFSGSRLPRMRATSSRSRPPTQSECRASWTSVPIRSIGVIDVFAILFLTSALLRVVATLIFLPLVQPEADRRHHKTRDALRYMTANIYNNVQTAIMQPIRWMSVRPRETFKTGA